MGWLKTTSTFGSLWRATRISVRRASLGWAVNSSSVAIHSAARALGRLCTPRWKDCAAVGRAPLHRNRNLPRAGHGAQKHGRIDVVVVGRWKPWAPGPAFRSAASPGRRPAWESWAASSSWPHSRCVRRDLLGPPFQAERASGRITGNWLPKLARKSRVSRDWLV